MKRERLVLGFLFVAIFAIRAIRLDQPIVENYVGRQIPTAMVARNLERGSGFLRPQLDTGPFPNLFLVEPPIYAQTVASIRPILGFDLESTGRLVSAAGITLGAWGLYGLVRRREGWGVAFLALASFGIFPVMIRYGRAFQPDALMLGCVLAGLRGWDEYEVSGNWRWALFGGFVLAVGLALKITVCWVLIPFLLIVGRISLRNRLLYSALMLIPALSWYGYAWAEVTSPNQGGSLAASENADLWRTALSPDAWLRFSTYDSIVRGLVYRSFTPIGFVLGITGLAFTGKLDRLWLGWGIGCAISILGLATKWHHAYYWMVVAPLLAVGVGRSLIRVDKLSRFGHCLAIGLGSFFLVASVVQSASTWKTPSEWQSLEEASRLLKGMNEVGQLVVAPEAVLYYGDLKGYRLEFNPESMKRAAREWNIDLKFPDRPLSLTEFYWEAHQIGFLDDSKPLELRGRPHFGASKNHLVVADVGSADREPRRKAWREAIRTRPNTKILFDTQDYLIAEIR